MPIDNIRNDCFPSLALDTLNSLQPRTTLLTTSKMTQVIGSFDLKNQMAKVQYEGHTDTLMPRDFIELQNILPMHLALELMLDQMNQV